MNNHYVIPQVLYTAPKNNRQGGSEPLAVLRMPLFNLKNNFGALKIKDIIFDSVLYRENEHKDTLQSYDGGATIIFEDSRFDNIRVSKAYVDHFEPYAGGYFMMDVDGNDLFSTESAFIKATTKDSVYDSPYVGQRTTSNLETTSGYICSDGQETCTGSDGNCDKASFCMNPNHLLTLMKSDDKRSTCPIGDYCKIENCDYCNIIKSDLKTVIDFLGTFKNI